MKFKSDIEVQAGLKDSSGAAGTSGQVLSSNGTTVSWVNPGAGAANDVQNQIKAGVAINKGQAVYVTGADGTNIIVGLASNTSEATSSKTLGLLNATVATNGFADVIQIGKLSGLNTIGAVIGDPVWLGTNGNLIYGLANKPYAPAHLVYIGVVTRVNANNGEIFVTVQNGFELKEIHDVDIITTTPTNGDVLGYNGSLWVNKTIPGWLGYTPANDANVVHLTGNETISGVKTFNDNIIANAFVKIGGNSTQYLKADGSVSTAMNSRIEADFVATSGQTTFVTPYEIGQIDVYYNGSKLYPNEFTATNGTDVVLAQAATLGAQISIVKYVSSFTTTSIRNESVFTTTGGQTTFAVNYAIGQVDVFYNGSKLNPSEFTATNGTSVVLGFACAAGESIVIDSFVNQVSGAVGTANRVSKFTGVASLGDSQIDDNGTNVSIGYTTNPNTFKLDINGSVKAGSFVKLNGTSSQFLKADGSIDSTTYQTALTNPVTGTGTTNYIPKFTGASSIGDSLISEGSGVINISGSLIAKNSSNYNGITVDNSTSATIGGGYIGLKSFNVTRGLFGVAGAISGSTDNNVGIFAESGAEMGAIKYYVNGSGTATHIMHSNGNVGIGTSTDAGYKLDVNGTGRINGGVNLATSSGNVGIGTTSPASKLHLYLADGANDNVLKIQQGTNAYASGINIIANNDGGAVYNFINSQTNGGTEHWRIGGGATASTMTISTGGSERMRITSGGNVGIGNGANVNSRLHVEGQDIYLTGATDNRIRFSNFGFTGNSMGAAIGYIYGVANTQEQGNLAFYTNPNTTGTPSLTERARITSGGDFVVGKDSAAWASDGLQTEQTGKTIGVTNSNSANNLFLRKNNTTGNIAAFYYNSVAVGTISITSSSTSYNTGSDYRLKEDLQIIKGLNLVSQIKVYDYKWKSENNRAFGVLAHELQEVVPQAVNGEKDGKQMQSVDYSKLVPILVAAIQELKAEIERISAKV